MNDDIVFWFIMQTLSGGVFGWYALPFLYTSKHTDNAKTYDPFTRSPTLNDGMKCLCFFVLMAISSSQFSSRSKHLDSTFILDAVWILGMATIGCSIQLLRCIGADGVEPIEDETPERCRSRRDCAMNFGILIILIGGLSAWILFSL